MSRHLAIIDQARKLYVIKDGKIVAQDGALV
jgi:formylmethanofuran dehydrogenase subunit A